MNNLYVKDLELRGFNNNNNNHITLNNVEKYEKKSKKTSKPNKTYGKKTTKIKKN